jgi:hypothetical protein
MNGLPSWIECRPAQGDYARVAFQLRALSFDHAQHLSQPLADAIHSLGLTSALIDLSGIEYLSSDVLGALLQLSRLLREEGGQVVIAHAGPIVRMVFTPFPDRQRAEPNRLAPFLFLDAPAPG